ncbi:hypothetical protein AKJ16_DCAP27618, partial [Drosera capensis]
MAWCDVKLLIFGFWTGCCTYVGAAGTIASAQSFSEKLEAVDCFLRLVIGVMISVYFCFDIALDANFYFCKFSVGQSLYIGSVAEKRGRAIHVSDLEELL